MFQKLIANRLETVVFPIREYRLNIGRLDDFERANGELEQLKTALTLWITNLPERARIVVLAFHSLEDRIVKDAFGA